MAAVRVRSSTPTGILTNLLRSPYGTNHDHDKKSSGLPIRMVPLTAQEYEYARVFNFSRVHC
jgi:hypothetical protein